jgi:hypothetical protein
MIDTSLEQRVYDMDTLDEESNYIEEILSKAADKWTDKEKVMVANAYKYAAETGDTKMFDLILQGCMNEEVELVDEWDFSNLYTYTIGFDQNKIENILNGLDEVDDVVTYNLLYRISKYSKTSSVELDKEIDISALAEKYDMMLSYDVDDNGVKSVTFEYTLKDLDIKETTEIERLDFSNAKITSEKALNLFDDSYIQSLNSTFAIAESQYDIDALSALYNLDYEKISLTDPTNISLAEQVNFTVFANNLIMYGTEENPMCEVENLINGLIMTDKTRCSKAAGNYGKSYMSMLANCTMAQIQCESTLLYKTISAEDKYEQYDEVREYMFQQCLFYSLYITIETGISTEYFGDLDTTYESGNQTFKITDLWYDSIHNSFTMDLGLYEYNELTPKSYRYYEGITMTKKEIEKYENGEYVFLNSVYLNVSLDTDVMGMLSTDTSLAYAEAREEMKNKQIEALYDMTMSIFGEAGFIPESVGDIIGVMSDALKSEGKTDYLSALCGVIGGESDDSSSDSVLGESNNYLSAIAKCAYEYYTAKQEYEEKVENISTKYNKYTMGIGITGSVASGTVLSQSGIYDPYKILAMKKYEQGGLNGCTEYVEGVEWTDDFELMDDDFESTGKSRTVNNVNDIRYKIGYIEDSYNYADFQSTCSRYSKQYNLDYDELVEILAECIDYLLYGNDPDGDGIIDYDRDLWDYDPFILNLAVNEIKIKGKINCLNYITEEYNQ